MRESVKTLTFVAAAVAMAAAALLIEPERRSASVLRDLGDTFYPDFKDPRLVRTIEVIEYDEATATARPLKIEFRKGRWVLPSHYDYVVEVGDRLVKTAAALVDLKRELVITESVLDHGKYGVIDPLDAKAASLEGRGKRVTLRDDGKNVLADFILGKSVDNKPGFRYVRVPGEKRVYAVKTDADPSARFADWVNAGLLRIAASAIRKVTILSYSIDEQFGRLVNLETVAISREGNEWKMAGGERLNQAAVQGIVNTLDTLKIVDVRPKPPSMAAGLRSGKLEMTLEGVVSMRQRGFFLAPTGRLLANEGEMVVETANGLAYTLRFGEIATSDDRPGARPGENRYLFVTVGYDAKRAAQYGDNSSAGERLARELTNRFADWYYVISGADFKKLRLKRADLVATR